MSEYICNTPSCAIALSKASFPVSMNCPVCQQALIEFIEKPLLSEEDELLISNLPYVIAYPLKRTLLEKHPWTKINLLKDTFLNFLKYLGLIAASEFFNSSLKDKKMVALFQQALAEPSFGSWNLYIRETLIYLKENNHEFFCEGLVQYYEAIETGKKRKLYKGEIEIIDTNGDIQLKKQEATAIGMLINFRNRFLGHGLTLDESDAVNLWEIYFPIFRELLSQMKFSEAYHMFKCEHGETYLLKSAEISLVERGSQNSASVWIENPQGISMDILPFFVVPGEVSIGKEDKEQLLTYESYTGKTIKFFSPEGTEKQTTGKILEKLNLLLRDKQKETPFSPEDFTKDEFFKRIEEENKLLLDTLISEKKIIPGIYQHREEMEIKLREWIGARASVFFIVAEAGSGKTNLLVEMQRQYTERQLPSLLIRAGRMEKQSLKEQIAYLLNIDLQQGLEKYASIAGTQAEPTFILIDGLNEANNAEEIWQDIIDLSKVFVPGSIKFVVTNRANTKSELSRYIIPENDYNLLYGENKYHETELGAYSFWLTALDMKEMKGAWESYALKDKTKFKPQFDFDAIAEFDRGLYNQISNPLILRLFLEIYNGKSLPKKGVKHLNIWQDWLKTFSEAEQTFLKLVANEVWQKGENELLLDDLLKHETLKPYFTSDIINSPYNRLKNNGWISRYVKDLNGFIGFTVEGALLYLLALRLQEHNPVINLSAMQSLITSGNKLQKSAIEAFLCEQALNGDLNLVTEAIDVGDEYIDVSINPLLLYLKTFGINSTIEKVLENPSEDDWKALKKLDKQLYELQLHVLRKELLIAVMPHNEFKIKASLEFGLKACSILDIVQAQEYLLEIDKHSELFRDDYIILENYGDVFYKFAQFDRALEYYYKCLHDELETLAIENSELASIYSKIGNVFNKKGQNEKALEYYHKCLDIELKTLALDHPLVAGSYGNIGGVWIDNGVYDKALEFLQKGLDINLKTYGEEHTYVSTSYNNIGLVWYKKGDLNKANDFYQKSLNIKLKTLGVEHPHVATSLSNIGLVLENKGEYDKALEFYQKSLNIELKTLGEEHPDVARSYAYIGTTWHRKGEYDKALEYYKKSLEILLKTLGTEHPDLANIYNNIAVSWSSKGSNEKTLEYYEKCLDITLKTYGGEHPSVALLYNNIGMEWDSLGEYDKALEFFQKSLNIELKTLGEENPDVARSYGCIGTTWYRKGEYDKALEYYEKSLEILLKTLGTEHPDVASSYNIIGEAWSSKGNSTIALDYYEKCLEIRLKMLGESHPDCATSFNNIGVEWNSIGEYDKAIEYYEKCLKIELNTLGEEHPSIATSYSNIGFALENKCDYLKAIQFYNQSKKIKINVFGEEHTSVSLIYFYIGRCFKNLGKYKDAIEAFKKGYEYYKKGGFPFNMAECYEKIGEGTKAFNYFLESAELRKIDPEIGIEAEATIDTIKNVLRLAFELNQMEFVPDWIKNMDI
ncbi:MAG: tetratricopeptide repeat protein [Flavobacteriia bacterium]|jgi:tetratricopeptide (TPR) repeat protein